MQIIGGQLNWVRNACGMVAWRDRGVGFKAKGLGVRLQHGARCSLQGCGPCGLSRPGGVRRSTPASPPLAVHHDVPERPADFIPVPVPTCYNPLYAEFDRAEFLMTRPRFET